MARWWSDEEHNDKRARARREYRWDTDRANDYATSRLRNWSRKGR